MSIIEQLDPVPFSNYLKKYHNTICGRHPIGVLLNVSIIFLHYIWCLRVNSDVVDFLRILLGYVQVKSEADYFTMHVEDILQLVDFCYRLNMDLLWIFTY